MKQHLSGTFLVAVVLFLLFPLGLFAQPPQYFNSASGTSYNAFPLNSTSSNKVQWIYGPNEFNSNGTTGTPAPAGTITKVYFRLGTTASGSATYTNFTISLGQNVGTQSTWAPSSTSMAFTTGLTQVFHQTSFTTTGASSTSWYGIVLQTPFYYNPANGLVFEMKVQSGTGNQVAQVSTSGNIRRIYGGYAATTGTANTGLVNFGFDIITGPPCNNVPTGLSASNITMTGATFNWNAVVGSQGYEYAITTSAPPPLSGTAIATNSHIATGLNVGTNYWFHVRNKCSTNSYSVWLSTPFSTLPCPSAGAPAIVTNVPGTVTFSWPGSTNPGVANYQYAVTGSAAVPTTWQTTTATTVTVPGLTPGNTYFAHVRSNCQTNTSTDQYIQFVNPFPPCYAPAAISISGVNMHGAYIRWNSSTTVPAAQGYQYAVNTNPNPPAVGTPTPDTFFTPTTLIGGVQYYVHVRTHCGTTNYSPWITDSFMTPATCLPTPTPTITNVTPYGADISWPDYPGINAYEYIINNSPSSPTVGGAVIYYNAVSPANLFSGTTYYFHLRVRCNAADYSPYVTTAFTTPAVCSVSPANLSMTAMTSTTATFNWNPVSGAQQYQYSVTTTPTPVAGNHYTSTPTVKVVMLTPNTSYYFHVRASCSASDTSGWETIPFSTAPLSAGAIATAEDFFVEVYPNPVRDVLQVAISGNISGQARLMLYDLTGKLIHQAEVTGTKTELDLRGLAQGTYLLKYQDAVSAGTLRVQKQ